MKTASTLKIVPKKNDVSGYLESKGIKPHPKFGDYQDYIEDSQKLYPSKLLYPDIIPARGSVHLALGLVMEDAELNRIPLLQRLKKSALNFLNGSRNQ